MAVLASASTFTSFALAVMSFSTVSFFLDGGIGQVVK
jgi:hypothetical protein